MWERSHRCLAIGPGVIARPSLSWLSIAERLSSRQEPFGEVSTSLRRQDPTARCIGWDSHRLPTEGIGPGSLKPDDPRGQRRPRRELFRLSRARRAGIACPCWRSFLVLLAAGTSWVLTIFLASLSARSSGWFRAPDSQRFPRLVADSAVRDMSQQLILLHEDLRACLRTVPGLRHGKKVDNERFDEHLERFREGR